MTFIKHMQGLLQSKCLLPRGKVLPEHKRTRELYPRWWKGHLPSLQLPPAFLSHLRERKKKQLIKNWHLRNRYDAVRKPCRKREKRAIPQEKGQKYLWRPQSQDKCSLKYWESEHYRIFLLPTLSAHQQTSSIITVDYRKRRDGRLRLCRQWYVE